MTRIFFIITFSLSLSLLTSQLITEHTLLDLLFNALVCVFFFFCITFRLNLKLWYTFAGHGPAPREFFLREDVSFNCDRGKVRSNHPGDRHACRFTD